MDHGNYQVPDDLKLDDEDYKALHPRAGYRPSQRHHRKMVMIIAIIILLLGLAAAGYWLWQRHQATPSPTKKQPASQPVKKQPAAPVTDAGNGLKRYKASVGGLNVLFEFPANWSAASPDTASQTITVTSPILGFVNARGTSTSGKIVVALRYGSPALNPAEQAATGAQASVQYGYSAPTSDQHVYFYLSFLHYQNTQPGSAFQELAITGIDSVAAGKPATQALQAVAPLVTATFYQCSNRNCGLAEATPLSLTQAQWQSDPNLQQVLALLESFQFS